MYVWKSRGNMCKKVQLANTLEWPNAHQLEMMH
jgi:hypothetical protein